MSVLKNTFLITILFLFSTNLFAQEYHGKQKDIQQILKNINAFSTYYKNGEAEKMAACYTDTGKIFPGRRDIIGGQKNLKAYWTLSEGVKVTKHKITPLEIRVVKKTAYDYGYYEGETMAADGSKSQWKGKYVIVWKKVGKDWKMELDIWNRIE